MRVAARRCPTSRSLATTRRRARSYGCGGGGSAPLPMYANAGHPDPRAEALGVGRDGQHRFCRRLEQQTIHRLLVPEGDFRELGRKLEDNVEILRGEQILGARLHPVPRGSSLTLRAVPVLTGIVGEVLVAAFDTVRHMPADCLGPAGLDHGHHLLLVQADMPGVGAPPRGTVRTEEVSDLQLQPGHPGARSH
jgi:hypothetical protein